jgi:hypothetical protein
MDHHPADAGETAAQAVDLEHHDQAHQRIADRLTNPAAWDNTNER